MALRLANAASLARRGQHAPVPSNSHRSGRHSEPDGGAATLELVVLFPILLLLIFGTIQGALYFHGRNVVLAAAQQGVRAARLDGQPDRAATAEQQTRQFLLDTGELSNLSGLTVVVSLDGNQVRVTVTGRTVSLLPGVPGPRVTQTAAGSLERFTSRTNP
jgi:Flp pilus assembly protein TadG